nr:hypothetical protein [Novosphingobium profundi]
MAEADTGRPSLSAWLWHPWYAKLWWAAIPSWWLGMAISTRIPVLELFYGSALAGILNVVFFPMTALLVLPIGFMRAWLDGHIGQEGGIPLSEDEEEELICARQRREMHQRFMDNLGMGTDMFDPRSGALWIGNPLNPNNPGYINPHTGKHL